MGREARAPDGHALGAAFSRRVDVVPSRSVALALGVAMRPRQWSKNLLLFAGLVFAAEFDRPEQWARAGVAFAGYCLASSAAYLVNDLRDAAADRLHPVKRLRPIAAGQLAPAAALTAAVLLAVGALGLALALGPVSAGLLAAFLSLQLGYTLVLKHVAVADVLTIAALFVMRAAAGAEAVDVRISPWLLVCTALLATLLAVGKRRAELELVADGRAPGRHVLGAYRRRGLDVWLGASLASCAIAYAAYAATAHSPWMLLTLPLVLVGLARYASLARRGLVEEPDSLLISDPVLLTTVGVWVVACGSVLAAT
jgi:4-hydroxybenzoate polyprenyltransferase